MHQIKKCCRYCSLEISWAWEVRKVVVCCRYSYYLFSTFCGISPHFSPQSALAGKTGTSTIMRRCDFRKKAVLDLTLWWWFLRHHETLRGGMLAQGHESARCFLVHPAHSHLYLLIDGSDNKFWYLCNGLRLPCSWYLW